MRTLKTSIVLLSLVTSTQAFAQDVEADDATAGEAAAGPAEEPGADEAPSAEPEPAPAPAPVAAPAPVVQLNADSSANVPVVNVGGPKAAGGVTETSNRTYGGPATEAEDEWKLSWSGYFRAPMRIGIGNRNEEYATRRPPEVSPTYPDQSGVTLSQPIIPDDQYLSWQYTRNGERAWAELFMHYGNSWAKGSLALQGFNFTDGGYNDQDAQFGFGLGYLTLTPDVSFIYDGLEFLVRAGVFWNRYGMAGKYDAGQYDTYLIGRTHHAGVMYRPSITLEDATIWFEHGFGTKQANPNIWTFDLFTLLHHMHLGVKWRGPFSLDIAAHWMRSWTQEPVHTCHANLTESANYSYGNAPADTYADASCNRARYQNATLGNFTFEPPDGRMDVIGLDTTMDFGALGRLFAGFSWINAYAGEMVGPAVEVVHAYGGGFFNSGVTGQYFTGNDLSGYPTNNGGWAKHEVTLNRGYGDVYNFMAQYDLSLSSLIGSEVFGDQALDLSAFSMLNIVNVNEAQVDNAVALSGGNFDQALLLGVDNIIKFKVGGELTYTPLQFMGIQFRMDHVRPNNYVGPVRDGNGSTAYTADLTKQAYTILSPRLIFKSNWATHEQLVLAYSYYAYANKYCVEGQDPRECTQHPTGTVSPDGFGTTLYNQGSTPELGRGAPSNTGFSDPNYTSAAGDPLVRLNNTQIPHNHVVRLYISIWF